MAAMISKTLTAANARLILAVLLGALLSGLSPPEASAHAAYVTSSPGFAEVVPTSPTQISITFSQELFRRDGANTIEVISLSGDFGTKYEVGPVQISNTDRRVMTVAVEETLLPRRYRVVWKNLSAEDGDEDSGWYPFYVRYESTNPAEVRSDREQAERLLVDYPGDEAAQSNLAVTNPTSSPTIVRTESPSEVNLGIGPVIWVVVGAAAWLMLVAALFSWLTRQRRAARQRRAE